MHGPVAPPVMGGLHGLSAGLPSKKGDAGRLFSRERAMAGVGHGKLCPAPSVLDQAQGSQRGRRDGILRWEKKKNSSHEQLKLPRISAALPGGPSNRPFHERNGDEGWKCRVMFGLEPGAFSINTGATEALRDCPSFLQCADVHMYTVSSNTPGCQGPRIWARSRCWAGRSLDLGRKAGKSLWT